jgi:callose synthase
MLYDIVLVLFFRILQTPQHYNVDKQQRFVNIDTSFTQKRSVMEKVIFS